MFYSFYACNRHEPFPLLFELESKTWILYVRALMGLSCFEKNGAAVAPAAPTSTPMHPGTILKRPGKTIGVRVTIQLQSYAFFTNFKNRCLKATRHSF